jgi:hypothetical protein
MNTDIPNFKEYQLAGKTFLVYKDKPPVNFAMVFTFYKMEYIPIREKLVKYYIQFIGDVNTGQHWEFKGDIEERDKVYEKLLELYTINVE